MVIEKLRHCDGDRKTHQVCTSTYPCRPVLLFSVYIYTTIEIKVVLLDHGMYRRLDPKLRTDNCKLWKAFMTRDTELGKQTSIDLGLPPERYAPALIYYFIIYSATSAEALIFIKLKI